MYEVIGIVGAAFVLGSWIYETYESVKKHKALIDLKFAVIYLIGNISLVTYSWLVQDMIFFVISSTIFVVVTFEIVYTIKKIKLRAH